MKSDKYTLFNMMIEKIKNSNKCHIQSISDKSCVFYLGEYVGGINIEDDGIGRMGYPAAQVIDMFIKFDGYNKELPKAGFIKY